MFSLLFKSLEVKFFEVNSLKFKSIGVKTLGVILFALLSAVNTYAVNEHVVSFPRFGDLRSIDFDDFIEQNPNISIVGQFKDWGEFHNDLLSDLLVERFVADVIVVDTSMHGRVLNHIDAIDLNHSGIFALSQIADNYKTKGYKYGRLESVSLSVGISTLFYRNDVLDKYNLAIEDITASWQRFIDFGRALKDDGIYLVNNANSLLPIIIQSDLTQSDYLYFDRNFELDIHNPRIIKAFELAHQIYLEGLSLETGIWNEQWYQSFKVQQAKVFSEINSHGLIDHLPRWIAPNNKNAWKVGPIPEDDVAVIGGVEILIPTESNVKQQALKVVEYLFDDQTMLNNFMQFAMFPTKENLYSHRVFKQSYEYFSNQKVYEQVIDNSKKITEFKTTDFDYFITASLNNAFEKVKNSEMSIDQALYEVEELSKEYINKIQNKL